MVDSMYSGESTLRILVTGGSGFIGTNVIEYLRRARPAATVVNLDNVPPRDRSHLDLWRPADLRDVSAVRRAVSEFSPTHVVHLGARTDLGGRSVEDYSANTAGLEAIIEAVDASDSVRRVIYFSSRLVCRIGYVPRADDDYCPPNPYGESKVVGERIVRERAKREWVILRPTSIWGPWFGVPYRDFFDSVMRGLYVHVGRRKIEKSFGFVGNTVHQIDKILFAESRLVASRTMYLGDYPPIEVAEFAESIRRQASKPPLRRVPEWLLRLAARAGDLLALLGWRRVPLTTFRLDNLLTPMVHDLSTLESVVGPLPYSADDGIRATLDWIKRYGEL